jgi:alpha-tubulin suppressor-like RCC1 family protein
VRGRRYTPIRETGDTTTAVYEWGQFGGGHQSPVAEQHEDAGGSIIGSPFGIGPVRRKPELVHGLPRSVIQISTSNSDDYALTQGGAVYAWGPGGQGELGNGTTERVSERAVRVDLPVGVRIASLPNPMPYNGAMAIARNGKVWAWGNDVSRDFCQARGTDLTRPVELQLNDVTLAAGALRHTIYDAGGRIVSCGLGRWGQLGNGTNGRTDDTGRPVAVHGLPAGRAIALTSAWGQAGVLMADGRYYDWGYNAGGQVGDGTRRNQTTAIRVALPDRVRSVFEGGSFGSNGQAIALLENGSLWEWGNGRLGQLGDRRRADAFSPIELRAPDRHFLEINSGGSTDYAIDHRRQLFAWGNNRAGQLGSGSLRASSPVLVRIPIAVSQVSSTSHNVAALGYSRATERRA